MPSLFEAMRTLGSPWLLTASTGGEVKKIKPEDVGVDPAQLPPDLISSFGQSLLMPKAEADEGKRIMAQGRRAVDRAKVAVGFFNLPFIPKGEAEATMLREFGAAQAEFLTWRADFQSRWLEVRQQQLQKFLDWFQRVWERLPQPKPAPKDIWVGERLIKVRETMLEPQQIQEKWRLTLEKVTDEAMLSWLGETVANLRTEVRDTTISKATEIVEGKFGSATAKALRRLAETMRDKNMLRDPVVAGMVDNVRRAAEGLEALLALPESQRGNTLEIVRLLTAAAEVTVSDEKNLSDAQKLAASFGGIALDL